MVCSRWGCLVYGSFMADLRSEFGGLDHKLRKNIFNSTMPTYARPEDGPARQVVYGVPPPPPPVLVRTQFPRVSSTPYPRSCAGLHMCGTRSMKPPSSATW